MSTTLKKAPPTPAEPEHDPHRWMYWAVGIVVVILAVIGLVTYSGQKQTEQAQGKAAELTQKLEQAGLRTPADQDVFVRTLGTDGGNVCANPGDALAKAVLFDQLANGASQVGRRPVIADRRVVQGQVLIMQTYCPDELPQFQDKIQDLKFDDVVKP